MEVLIEGGADVNAPGENGRAPLHVAAEKGHLEAAHLLLALGADLDARGHDGRTPLESATSPEMAELLARHQRARA